MHAVLINQRILQVVNCRRLSFMVKQYFASETSCESISRRAVSFGQTVFYMVKTVRRFQTMSDYDLFDPIINIDKLQVFYFHYAKYVKQFEMNKREMICTFGKKSYTFFGVYFFSLCSTKIIDRGFCSASRSSFYPLNSVSYRRVPTVLCIPLFISEIQP